MTDHIQIGDVSPRVRFIANGVDTDFPFGFPIFKDADLKVYVDGVERETGFAVAGAGQSAGGTVTFDIAPADQAVVVLLRRLAIVRTTDFQESGEFRAKAINDELDYQTAALQQISDDVERAMALDPTDATASITLPLKDDRAGKYLAFDAEGKAMAVAGEASVAVSSSMEPVVQAANLTAARDALGLGDAATKNVGTAEGDIVVVQAGGALPALDGSALTGIVAGATDAERANILLNAFRIQVVGGLSVLDMIDGVVDEFEDDSGVDAESSTGGDYMPDADCFTNRGQLTPDLMPTMTSLTTPYVTITHSNLQANAAWWGFDDGAAGDTQIYWNGFPCWVVCQFPAAKVVTAYTFYPQGTQYWPKTWVFQGSNDGSSWTNLHSVTNHATTGWIDVETFEFSNVMAYTHYRLYITAGDNGTYCWLSEIEFKSRSEPILVSSSATPLYTALDGSYPASRLNDGNISSSNETLGVAYAKGVGSVAGYDFGRAVEIRRMVLSQPYTNYASAVGIETSDDNSEWTYRETISGIVGAPYSELNLQAWGEHRYWRIKVNSWVDNATFSYWYITEMQCFAVNGVPDMTLVSETTTAETQPDEALLVVWEEDVDVVSLDQDLTAYVTRDGGTTWTEAALIEEGSLSAGRILTASADLSAQPDGTRMAWKLVSANNKQLRIHGVGLEWR